MRGEEVHVACDMHMYTYSRGHRKVPVPFPCNGTKMVVQRSVPFKRKKLFRRLIERCDRFACEVPSSPCPFRILTKNHLQLAVWFAAHRLLC